MGNLNKNINKTVNNVVQDIRNKNYSIKFVEFIIKNTIEPVRDNECSPLIWSIMYGYTETAELLIRNGTDLNVKDKEGNTALMWAIKNGFTEIAKLLIEKGTNLNLQGFNNNTALIYAVKNNNTEIAKLLIQSGSDVNKLDNHNKTALDYAKDDEIKQLILEAMENQKRIKNFKTNTMLNNKAKTFGELTEDDYIYIVYKLEVPRVLKLRVYTVLRKENNNKDVMIYGVTNKNDYIESGNTLSIYETDKYIITTDKEYIYPYILKEMENYVNKIRTNISKIRTLNYENETCCDVIDQLIKMIK